MENRGPNRVTAPQRQVGHTHAGLFRKPYDQKSRVRGFCGEVHSRYPKGVRPSSGQCEQEGVSVKKLPSNMLLPVGAGVAALIVGGITVGFAQMPVESRTGGGEPAAASSPSPSNIVEASPRATVSGAPAESVEAAGPSAAASEPGPPAQSSGPAADSPDAASAAASEPEPGSPASVPASAPQTAVATEAPADAVTVQRVKDSCSSRLESDAASSSIVAGPVVGRPFTLVSLDFLSVPQRSTATSGLASYDVSMTVTTQMLNSPTETSQRVCRVYDYDSHVDWLPAN
ncbi:hypothetical protein JOE31_004187 [Arthrobacter sp. PvP023]|nr:hypothetical protein [Arthrobacter sp. PvP023]